MVAYTYHLVHRAIERYVAEGRDATVAYYNDPATIDGQWYVAMSDDDGTSLAVPVRPDLVGGNVADLVDPYGKAYGAKIAAAGANGRWVSYFFVDPSDGETKQKHYWAIRYDGLIIGSGWYEVPEPTGDTGPAEDTATG